MNWSPSTNFRWTQEATTNGRVEVLLDYPFPPLKKQPKEKMYTNIPSNDNDVEIEESVDCCLFVVCCFCCGLALDHFYGTKFLGIKPSIPVDMSGP